MSAFLNEPQEESKVEEEDDTIMTDEKADEDIDEIEEI